MQRHSRSRVHSSLQEDYPPKHTDDEQKVVFSHQNTQSLLAVAAQDNPAVISPIKRFKDRLEMIGERYASQEHRQNVKGSVGQSNEQIFDAQNLHRLINLEATPSKKTKIPYYYMPRELPVPVSPPPQLGDDDAQESLDIPQRLISHRRMKLPGLRKDGPRNAGLRHRQQRYRTEQDDQFQGPEVTESQDNFHEIGRKKTESRQMRYSLDEHQQKTKYLPKPEKNAIAYNYSHASYADLWRTVPRELHNRTEQNMRQFAFRCHKINPLLKKLEYVTMVEMLKACRVSIYDKGDVVYSPDKRPTSSYIILWGKVSLVDMQSKNQTTYETGQTLHEDYLLEYRRYELKTLNNMVVATQPSGLLELDHKNLIILKTELMEINLRSDLQILESEFRKNYLTKLSLRETFRLKQRSHSKHIYY